MGVESLHEANATAAAWFREQLLADGAGPGATYLARRGVGPAVRERFRLGLAPRSPEGLASRLEEVGVPADAALELGLTWFRDRVMCPILAPDGAVLGFTGRVIGVGSGASAPNYLNSPESAIYRKREALFGLHAATAAIARRGRALLVEGVFDVLALHEAGFDEAVAPLGWAFTPAHAEPCSRATPRR